MKRAINLPMILNSAGRKDLVATLMVGTWALTAFVFIAKLFSGSTADLAIGGSTFHLAITDAEMTESVIALGMTYMTYWARRNGVLAKGESFGKTVESNTNQPE